MDVQLLTSVRDEQTDFVPDSAFFWSVGGCFFCALLSASSSAQHERHSHTSVSSLVLLPDKSDNITDSSVFSILPSINRGLSGVGVRFLPVNGSEGSFSIRFTLDKAKLYNE